MPRSRRTFGEGREPTVDEFCLLYLGDRPGIDPTAPTVGQLTQEAIATALGKLRANISRSLANLVRRLLVMESLVHVKGVKRRMSAYFLTAHGLGTARSLRGEFEERTVRVEFPDGHEEVHRLHEVPGLLGRRVPFADLLMTTSGGRIRIEDLVSRLQTGGRARVADVPVALVPRFVGREAELVAIRDFLAEPAGLAVVLTGLAGIGKTTLARRFVEEARATRPVLWRAIVPETSPFEVASQVVEFLAPQTFRPLSALLQTPAVGSLELARVLAKELARVGPLVVLDDLNKGSDEVHRWLGRLVLECRASRGTQFILISRTRPKVYDRSMVAREGVVRELSVRELPEAAAVELLRGRVPPADIGIGVRLGRGNPLFLHLVAELGLSPPRAMQELRDFLEEQVIGELAPTELRILEQAAVFEGPAPREALHDVGSPKGIAGLVERGILEPAGDAFVVHDVVREVVLRAVPGSRLRALHGRAGTFAADEGSPEAILRAARHFVHAGDHGRAANLLRDSGAILIKAGIAVAMDPLAQEIAAKVPRSRKVEGFLLEGQIAEATGAWDRAIRCFRQAGVLQRDSDGRVAAECQLCLGRVLARRMLHGEAASLLARARDAYEKLGDPTGLSEALYWMAVVSEQGGHLDDAEALYGESRAVAFAAGDRVREGLAVYGLGGIADRRRDFEEAVRVMREAATTLEKSGSLVDVARVLTGLAGNLLELKRYAEALDYQDRAIAMARRTGDLYVLSNGLYNRAMILNLTDRFQVAEEAVLECLESAELLGRDELIASAHTLLGRILSKKGERERSLEHWRAATVAAGRLESPTARGFRLLNLAMNCLYSGERELADGFLLDVKRLAAETRDPLLARRLEDSLPKFARSYT